MKIGILEDHALIAELLKENLNSKLGYDEIYIFNNSERLFSLLQNEKLDFLFLDMYINNENGINVLKECRKHYNKEELKIIILSSSVEPKIISDSFKYEANGYVTKHESMDEIIEVFQNLIEFPLKNRVSSSVSDILLEYNISGDKIKLSPREEQLLALICNAKSAKEIAYELDLSLNTIHYYTKRLMIKMGVNRTPDLILKAIEKGYHFIN